MKSVNKTQIAVVSGSIILIVLLLLANTKLPPNKEEAKMSDHAGPNTIALTTVVQNAINGLSKEQKQKFKEIRQANKEKKESISSNDQLTESEKKDQLKKLHKEAAGNMNNILSQEQRDKMKAMRKEKKVGHNNKSIKIIFRSVPEN